MPNFDNLPSKLAIEAKKRYVKPDYSMTDGFGRDIDEDIYWRNTGLSADSIERIKRHKAETPSPAPIGVLERP